MKRIITLAICAITAVAMSFGVAEIPGFTGTAKAATASDLNAVKGVYWFAPHVLSTDLTDTYVYNDRLLTGDSRTYNKQLATMSYELAVTSVSSDREPKTDAGYANKSRNVKAYLEDNGFVDFATNKDYKTRMRSDTMGVACAHKKITENGKTYTVLVIVPRNAGYEAEWGSNYMLSDPSKTGSDKDDHFGFKRAKNNVLSFAKQYVQKYGIKGDIKVWAPGYSRGAGVMNLIGAALIDNPKGVLGSSITLKPRDLYCYTYGTPRTASTSKAYTSAKYDYIHNLYKGYDKVASLLAQSMGVARYGQNKGYEVSGKKQQMLNLLKATNSAVYKKYTTNCDPDGFTPMKFDQQALLKGQIKYVPDKNSYLKGYTQEKFLGLVAGSIAKVSKSASTTGNARDGFAKVYQGPFSRYIEYDRSHTKTSAKRDAAMSNSKAAIPSLLAMYELVVLEKYAEKPSEKAKTAIQQSTDYLLGILKKIPVGTGEDAKIIAQVTDFQSTLSQSLATEDGTKELIKVMRDVTAKLYSKMMTDSLAVTGTETTAEENLKKQIKSYKDCYAMSHMQAHMMLDDSAQKPENMTFNNMNNEQFKHYATWMGNDERFSIPHSNEVILSWLKTADPYYSGWVKENAAQKAGYRRVYISKPSGVNLTGTVKNASGSVVAKFKNGKMTSSNDTWVRITTCDKGNWLRLPLDKTYKIDLSVSKQSKIDMKVTEYQVYTAKQVRTVKQDNNFSWTGFSIAPSDKYTLVVSAVSKTDDAYKLPSTAKYYIKDNLAIENTAKAKEVLIAAGAAKGKSQLKVSWNKVKGAKRYVVYFAKKNKKLKKVKILKAAKKTWIKKKLKKNKVYKFKVVAQKKKNGKYVNIAKSKIGYVVIGKKTKKYTNPKKLTLKKKTVVLKQGKTFKVKATVKKVNPKKKLLGRSCAAKFRYKSNNKIIATVSKKGVVKAKSRGTCKIYVQTVNGIGKSMTVTVK